MSVNVRRFLLVLPLLAVGTALAAATIGVLDPRTLVGLRFVAAVSLPLFAIEGRWPVGVELVVAISAAILISVSFPVLVVGTVVVAIVIATIAAFTGMMGAYGPDPYVPAMMVTSALGARFVAAALARMTRHRDRALRLTIVAWGACWPLLRYVYSPRAKHIVVDAAALEWLFPHHPSWFGPFSVLAWQIPVGLACVIWFLRAAPTPRPAASAA